MIPVININGMQLTLPQIRVFRKLILGYIESLSEMIWTYVEENNPDMASLPAQRARCFEMLELVDGTLNMPLHPPGFHTPMPHGTDVNINGNKMLFAYGEVTRIVLSAGVDCLTTQEEIIERNAMLSAVFAKVNS